MYLGKSQKFRLGLSWDQDGTVLEWDKLGQNFNHDKQIVTYSVVQIIMSRRGFKCFNYCILPNQSSVSICFVKRFDSQRYRFVLWSGQVKTEV